MLAVAGVPDTSAQKLTYKQAFAKCKVDEVDKTPTEHVSSSHRYPRSLSCMKKI